MDTRPPRRADLLQNVPAELAIREAVRMCETTLPADTRETMAVVKLQEALDFVGDLVDTINPLDSSRAEPKEVILAAGWTEMPVSRPTWPPGRYAFEKGNYWLFLDERRKYKDADYVQLSVRDPVAHMKQVGDDSSYLHATFPWKGPETISLINQLLPE